MATIILNLVEYGNGHSTAEATLFIKRSPILLAERLHTVCHSKSSSQRLRTAGVVTIELRAWIDRYGRNAGICMTVATLAALVRIEFPLTARGQGGSASIAPRSESPGSATVEPSETRTDPALEARVFYAAVDDVSFAKLVRGLATRLSSRPRDIFP
jgi:hypothetical protein